MTIEEYILKRKKEDGINECDLDKRLENTRICVNYVFEYFDNYLSTAPVDQSTILHEQKIERYRKFVQNYDPEVQEWLVSLYASYGTYMHVDLMSYITAKYFLLFDSDAEFRSLSYEIYPKVVKKFKFLEGQSEMVFSFIKDAHRVKSLILPCDRGVFISNSTNEWIDTTYKKFGVNIYNFCFEWVRIFGSNPSMWPKSHKHRSESYETRLADKHYSPNNPDYYDYDYKQKNNLFGLDSLYAEMPKKSFIRGRKQDFETVLMYCWLHCEVSDDEYWDTYSNNIL